MPERFFDALVIQHFLEEFSFSVFLGRHMRLMAVSLINNWMGREDLGARGIWGRVQGVGSDHWGTRSLPSLAHHPRAARSRAKRAF